MAIVRCIVTLESASAVPANRATNTYHFETVGLTSGILDNIADLMRDLYADEPDATPLDELMSNQLCGTKAYVQLYDLADPEPRTPVGGYEFDLAPISTPCLPAEVALCVSFRGDYESGTPNARRRGRVYMPWHQQSGSSTGRPSPGLIDEVTAAYSEFKAAVDASANVSWIVYSPTDDAAVPITLGWVDNAWDTQRRRGNEASSRTYFT